MKIKKKILSGLTAGILSLISVTFSLSAADAEFIASKEDPRFRYTYIDQNQQTVSIAANGNLTGNITIPSVIDGKKVTAISEYGFSEQVKVTGITIPESVTKIDSFAFNNCTALKNVKIPDSVINMGTRPFILTEYESVLEKNAGSDFVLINDYILYKYIGNKVNIDIPDGVRVIAGSVFAYDEDINSIVCPDSVQYICEYAFWDCNHIKSVTFGNGITNIKLNSFTSADMAIYGYLGSYAQKFAQNNKYTFVPLMNYGDTRTEIIYTKDLRQYYFSDETSFSRSGIKVCTRKYDGTLTEIPDWDFTSSPDKLYN